MTPEKVSIDTIVNTLHTYATRARTDEEKTMLHRLGTDLANRIRQDGNPNFNQGEFLRACSIQPEWGKLSAAA